MADLTYQRCFNHATREAVARCPQCGRFFCRECVTEHDGRAICAGCLRQLAAGPGRRRSGLARVALRVGQCAVGLVAAWFFFYLVGERLLTLPSSFHEGTLWQAGPWD